MRQNIPGNKFAALRFMALFALLALTPACAQVQPEKAPLFPGADFSLTILHTNDVHASFGGSTAKGLNCYAAWCEGGRGGYVRLDQAVRALRQNDPNALFLEAGDIFQGTLFWTQHKERMPLALLDKLGYQAIVPGNHEFDEGWPAWLRFVDGLNTPVLAANVSFDFCPNAAGPNTFGPNTPGLNKLRPYIVLERQGRKIGIVGLITESTPLTSSPGPGVSFNNAQKALEKAIEELRAQNVNIIIALAHLGLENERLLARSVDGVDIIVGAHSHSLLSNSQPKGQGPYPLVEKSPDGTTVLVVTASTACAYLGKLEVGFDKNGVARQWRGDAISLDQAALAKLNAPPPNAELAALIEEFAAPVKKMLETSIGTINAPSRKGSLALEEPSVTQCRRGECLSGNIAADALRLVPFEDAQIALLNSGALRSSLPEGQVAPGDVLAALPFQNTPLLAEMPGEVILQALEHGVFNYGAGEGSFLQVSGLRYAFTPANKPGQRVSKVEVLGENGRWQALNKKQEYRVVTLDFLVQGGDGFSMLAAFKWRESGTLASDALKIYLERESPLRARLEGRITILK